MGRRKISDALELLMAILKNKHSKNRNEKWIAQGRGKGRGAEYNPWLTVWDVPSDGRSHRVFGHTTGRIHHLLSDLELATFLMFEWDLNNIDIREQFPLQPEITSRLAEKVGIKHPVENGELYTMSTDFLINQNNAQEPMIAIQVKPASRLSKSRTIELLELERLYWKEKGVPWKIITENELSKQMTQNISWLYPEQREEISPEVLNDWFDFYAQKIRENGNKRIIDLCKQIDSAYQLELGQSLSEVRQLIAKRFFIFDLSLYSVTQLTCENVLPQQTTVLLEALNVSGQ
jgi:hypothetical protein